MEFSCHSNGKLFSHVHVADSEMKQGSVFQQGKTSNKPQDLLPGIVILEVEYCIGARLALC